jgi:dihydroorotate dehydrogenase electron transfer subunit
MKKYAPERVPITAKRHLSNDYYSLRMGPCSGVKRCRPGQFVHLGLPGCDVFFRRAMSIATADPDSGEIEIIFKVFGRGTARLAMMKKGDELDVLGPLGTAFTRPRKREVSLLVGGGVGFPPLYFMAQHLVAQGHDPKSIEFFYGGRTSGEIVERTRIRRLGVHFHSATDDGSYGTKGLITDALLAFLAEQPKRKYRLYSCGPEPMLKAVDDLGRSLGIPGQLSLEAPMPCGFGVCLGCIVALREGGYARVCTEGPVFKIGEVEL